MQLGGQCHIARSDRMAARGSQCSWGAFGRVVARLVANATILPLTTSACSSVVGSVDPAVVLDALGSIMSVAG
jgi:hypothetical protein